MDEFDPGAAIEQAQSDQGPHRNIDAANPDAVTVAANVHGTEPQPAQAVSQIPQTERMVDVTDTTATPRYPKRIHEIVADGRIVEHTFRFGKEPTRMPYAHGMKFLHIPSFEVRHLDGTLIPPLPNLAEQGNGVLALRASQVIAELDELSEEALVRRCNAISGGERMLVSNGKDSLVRFLLNREIRKREAAASKEDAETDVGGATMSNEPAAGAMDSLFAGMSGDA